MWQRLKKKEDKYFGGLFYGINLPPESRTTSSEHPADFSSYLNLQPPSEKYFYPTLKTPITFHPLTFCLNMSTPLLLQASLTPALLTLIADLFSSLRLINLILTFESVIACTCSSSCTEYSCQQMRSSLFTDRVLEPVNAGELSPGRPSQQSLIPIGLDNAL